MCILTGSGTVHICRGEITYLLLQGENSTKKKKNLPLGTSIKFHSLKTVSVSETVKVHMRMVHEPSKITL